MLLHFRKSTRQQSPEQVPCFTTHKHQKKKATSMVGNDPCTNRTRKERLYFRIGRIHSKICAKRPQQSGDAKSAAHVAGVAWATWPRLLVDKVEAPVAWLTLEGEQKLKLYQRSGDSPLNHNKQKCKMFANNQGGIG